MAPSPNEQVPPESMEETLRALAEENRKRRESRSVLLWLFGILAFALVAAKLVDVATDIEVFRWNPIGLLFGIFVASAAISARHKTLLKRICEWTGAQSAGFLLEAYATADDKEVREVCLSALPDALTAVSSSDELDAYQRGLLYQRLSVSEPATLVDAALTCTGRIAGAEAIPSLERFQRESSRRSEPKWQRLGVQALQVLPTVRIRAAREIIDRRLGEAEAVNGTESTRLGLDAPVERITIGE